MRALCLRILLGLAALMAVPSSFATEPDTGAGASPEDNDRQALVEWLYNDCLAQNQAKGSDSFCHCFSDYFNSLITTAELRYIATYRASTPQLEDKAKRSFEMCALMQPQ